MNSSNILSMDVEERPWGRFFVIHDQPSYKLKELKLILVEDFHINTIISVLKHGL
jgi:hypothetical protein